MLSGRCLCGAVRYKTSQEPRYVFNCYCATCRRESGAGHATVIAVSDSGFNISGDVKMIAPPREGGAPPIPRFFCSECGTTLFARPPGLPNMITLRAGTLEGIFDLKIEQSAFVSQAQPWDKPPADIPAVG
ncbi:MAG: GFA family protein [Alphaproteobacteria bacterium]